MSYRMRLDETCCEWTDVDRIANGLVGRRVNDVAKHWFSVLNRTTFGIAITQEDEFLLLTSPECAHTFGIDFDHTECEIATCEHYDLLYINVDVVEAQYIP